MHSDKGDIHWMMNADSNHAAQFIVSRLVRYATLCIRENPGCMFIATNCDSVAHFTECQEWAGIFFLDLDCSSSIL